ncbi:MULTISPECIES: adenylate/guanylate cyclase domain-containing protein [unclassified Rhizobium]|uniref:adenylate/guanylate cyclase domain-containing protein n=1 Tax=unclassified Rhizobium TaxID=2613769 RepID=UPI002167CA1D|nr:MULTISPECIES: adenylate/guanylate cyclase domain-containing protein [unclassified Rhizobium]MCS3743379.1 class 3 adenylate cyclase/CHASE3 domain sensor protein/putative methionine-R-sulfoxide reductase with GAF domain [Rhizobium sp. BK661]MCS4095904.1 class 3 adenylate cyclase/CHASE3 domain sensor protein/putative methionine-R-sulfoxide reductase with GAF domain [Rhizobium sp. BK176]
MKVEADGGEHEERLVARNRPFYVAPLHALVRAASPALRNLNIGGKLTVGFGILAALTLLVVGLNYLGSLDAVRSINRTTDLSAPSAVASARAQADLLRMLSAVRGYLALGEESYRDNYTSAKAAFLEDMQSLENLLRTGPQPGPAADVAQRMRELHEKLSPWQPLTDRLFELRNDQLRREPALKLLVADANPLIATIVGTAKALILAQQKRDATPENMVYLADLASFQSSFYAMVAGLRGYVTTKRDSFKYEYEANFTINDAAWKNITEGNAALTPYQEKLIDKLSKTRAAFLQFPAQMFSAVEGDHAREDLYLFRTQAVPLAEGMLGILDEIANEEQQRLQADLGSGRDQLETAQRIVLLGGVAAAFLGLILGLIFRESIAGPIQRLTGVADRVRQGDLAARAQVESGDEIGKLATTFNNMTEQLGSNLDDLENRRRQQEQLALRFRRQSEYLAALHDTSLGLIARLDLTELLSDLTTRAAGLLGTEHGYVYLVDQAGEVLQRMVGVGVYTGQAAGQQLKSREGVAGVVWHTGAALVINEYATWSGRAAAAAQLDVTIRAVMAVPLKSDDQVIGVLGIAYDDASALEFGTEEVELLKRFGQLASIALENARLHTATEAAKSEAEEASIRIGEQNRALEAVASKLSKYLSPQVFASIFSGKQNVEISSTRKKLTVFFSDIADFTATTDKLESEELTDLLNHYLTEMAKLALEYGATIDKFIGDAILVFFGDPETRGIREDALACVRMAISMQSRMQELRAEWAEAGFALPFHLRIGINTGYCTVGNFGSADRMDYTIIGGEVNLASRLQSHADLGGILLADETYALVKEEIEAEELPPLTVKGFAYPIKTYRVIGFRIVQEAMKNMLSNSEDGLQLDIDSALKGTDREKAIKALEHYLATLRR